MVQQIDIKGISVSIIFGMHFAENFTNEISGQIKDDGSFQIGSSKFTANVIWFGYLN